jgi:hypothetical protein
MCSYKPPPKPAPEKNASTKNSTGIVNAVVNIADDVGKLGGNLAEIADDIGKLIEEVDKIGGGSGLNETISLSDDLKDIKFIKTFAKGGLITSVAIDLGVDSVDAVAEALEKGGKTNGWAVSRFI